MVAAPNPDSGSRACAAAARKDIEGVAEAVETRGAAPDDWPQEAEEVPLSSEDVELADGAADEVFVDPGQLACPGESPEVLVHVYDLWGCRSKFTRLLNSGTTRYGLFHTGVEVYGREWYFCGTDQAFHGVYSMPHPKQHPLHQYRFTVSLGQTQLSRDDLEELIPLMRDKWPGICYHPFKRNCHHFTNFFCQVLGFPEAPKFGVCGAGCGRLALAARRSKNSDDPTAARRAPALDAQDDAGVARCSKCLSMRRLTHRSAREAFLDPHHQDSVGQT